MPRPTKAEIEARLLELEAENAQLRAAAEEARASAATEVEPAPPVDEAPAPRARRSRGRAAVAVTLIVIGALVAPLATVAAFTARQLSDTDVFVDTLAPLADEPAVQQLIIDEAATAIDEALDTDALVADLLDSIIDEDERPRLAVASERLGPLLADQARTATRSALTRVVESDAFPAIWEQALQLTHVQMVGVLEADEEGAVTIDDSGVVAIQLQPIIAQLKPALVDAGFSLADSIPEVDATIVVAEIPQIAQARLGYALLLTIAQVLPWIAIGLLVIGVAMHPRSSRAVVLAGTLVLIEGALLGSAIALGGSVAAAFIASQVPTAATMVVYQALTAEVAAVMLAYVVIGVVAIIAGLLAGSSLAAARARAAGSRPISRVSGWLDAHGWRPSELSLLLQRQTWVLWVWLGAIFVVLAATLRPLTPGGVLLGTVILGVAALLYAILRGTETTSRGAAADADGEDSSPAAVEGAADRDPSIAI
ncbi:hypothetical protein [Demequina sp. NBRC 110056]|uniref:hypothetical protein n=1 Tax=Demequina sp. NBRC 110056 TaxID=1570345 RepID=UPI000A003CD2|nr:hypothetical protein [Demequina sp. NBRC 110056]